MTAGARTPVGVLALQGDFAAHARVLEALGARSVAVREREDLCRVRGIVLPGGESGVMLALLRERGLDAEIRSRVEDGVPVLGTCAGAIALSRRIDRPESEGLGLLDAEIERNAYGRQRDSFAGTVETDADGLLGLFIRAPRFTALGDGVQVLGRHAGDPVWVREGDRVACTFHPELGEDHRVHAGFLGTIQRQV